MQELTIQEAAATTSWSPRMLRYLERVGLLATPRTTGGYRVYGAAELQRLRTLRELLGQHHLARLDVAFAAHARRSSLARRCRRRVGSPLEAKPRRPETVSSSDWLRFEHDKCRKLLASAAA